jgi:putative ABC transport system permease protein
VSDALEKRHFFKKCLFWATQIKNRKNQNSKIVTMLQNYFKIAFRSLRNRRVYSFVNITGLALGITAFILILQYVSLEQSVNHFHTKLPQIYRVLCQNPEGKAWSEVEPGWAMKSKDNFSEIQAFCRFEEGIGAGIVKNEAKNVSFREKAIGYAEGNFFDFFSFTLLLGDKNAFQKADVVFISNSYAKKYFGEENPMGKTLQLFNQFGEHRYTIEGVYADMGENSDIRYDMVFSLETLKNPANLGDNDWANLNNLDSQFSNLFLLLNEKTDIKALEQKMTTMRRTMQPEKDAINFRLQAFGETHLASSFNDDLSHTGNVRYVYMLMSIALLILLIAWFNYVNLSTANALRRSNEVGVRKAIGASKSTLIAQFLTETVLVNFIAFGLAFVLIVGLQPFFNELIGKKLDFSVMFQTQIWFYGLVTMLLGSLLSGIYTAGILTGFNPTEALRGKLSKSIGGLRLRQSLVVTQFAISTALILFTVLIYSQLKYMQSSNIGLDTAQLMIITGPEIGRDSTYKARKSSFINELAAQSYIQNYCLSGCVPSDAYNFATEGFSTPKTKASNLEKAYKFAEVSERFLPTYSIKMTTGRNFTAAECNVKWNDNSKIMVNEKALSFLGLTPEEALTTKVKWDERYLEIVGVVQDYHHTSLQKPIEPTIFYPSGNSAYFTVRLTPDNMQYKIASLEKLHNQYFLGNPFEYFFADDNYQKAYQSETQFSKLFASASIWAIFIACLGLFGLVTFTIESKVKEIGIRKVLGASIAGITGLLAKDFLKLVLIAIVIASPIAYYFMQQWLADFAYRIDIQAWMFVAAGFAAVLIAFLTVGFQSVKAALANPVKSLRSE